MGDNFFGLRFQGLPLSDGVEDFVKNGWCWVGEYTNFLRELNSQLLMGPGAEQIVRVLD
jgi:hypothetical protein